MKSLLKFYKYFNNNILFYQGVDNSLLIRGHVSYPKEINANNDNVIDTIPQCGKKLHTFFRVNTWVLPIIVSYEIFYIY